MEHIAHYVGCIKDMYNREVVNIIKAKMGQPGAQYSFISHYNTKQRSCERSLFFSNRIEPGTWQNKGLGKEDSVSAVPLKS